MCVCVCVCVSACYYPTVCIYVRILVVEWEVLASRYTLCVAAFTDFFGRCALTRYCICAPGTLQVVLFLGEVRSEDALCVAAFTDFLGSFYAVC